MLLLLEELWLLLCPFQLQLKISDCLFQLMANSTCIVSDTCCDDAAALNLNYVAIVSILLAGVFGVAIPLVGKNRRFLRTDGSLFVGAKAFAARVIMVTGFVHMLSGGTTALNIRCLPEFPWSKFLFAGFFAMMASLATLLVESYERKQGLKRPTEDQVRVGSEESGLESGIVSVQQQGKPIIIMGRCLGRRKAVGCTL